MLYFNRAASLAIHAESSMAGMLVDHTVHMLRTCYVWLYHLQIHTIISHQSYARVIICSNRVYFRISLKRGQMHCCKFQEEANPNPKGGAIPY